jgi:8-oxo-dGTP pyrophosphatase MutT (NUDIX family)
MVRVVVGALVREDRVLLGHRSARKRAFPGVWDLPGGVVEDGESERQALARELHEELGVRIASGATSHLCRVVVRPAGEPVELSAWLVTGWQGTPANLAPDEHDEIEWFDLVALPPLANGLVRRSLLRAVRDDRADD